MSKMFRSLNIRLSIVILIFMLITSAAFFSTFLFYYRMTVGHSLQKSRSISAEFMAYPNVEEAIASMPPELQELFLAHRTQQAATKAFVDRLSRDRWLITFGLILVLGPIFFALSTLLGRFLTRPIWLLTGATKRIASGDFTVRTEPNDMYWDGYSLTLAKNFNIMAAALESFENERKTMIADIAHELRTPLTSMQLQLEAAQDGIDPLSPELIDRLYDETHFLSSMIVDLRTLSLAEADQLSLEEVSFNLYEFAKRTVARFQIAAERKEISLFIKGEEDVYLYADEKHLSQVLNNLISNAIKYSPERARVTLSFDAVASGVNIAVANTGNSLAQEDLDNLFERFYRSDQGLIRAEGGSGLGLAIVKALIERHKGTITVKNLDEGGLIFSLFLPQNVS